MGILDNFSLQAVLEKLGIRRETVAHSKDHGVCPVCGFEAEEGSLLCAGHEAIVQTVCQDLGKEVAEMAMSRVKIRAPSEKAEEGAKTPFSIFKYIGLLSGKNPDQANAESMAGYCPDCGGKHHNDVGKFKTRYKGPKNRVILCSSCFSKFDELSTWAKAFITAWREKSLFSSKPAKKQA